MILKINDIIVFDNLMNNSNILYNSNNSNINYSINVLYT